jgi:hypothetical protein
MLLSQGVLQTHSSGGGSALPRGSSSSSSGGSGTPTAHLGVGMRSLMPTDEHIMAAMVC